MTAPTPYPPPVPAPVRRLRYLPPVPSPLADLPADALCNDSVGRAEISRRFVTIVVAAELLA